MISNVTWRLLEMDVDKTCLQALVMKANVVLSCSFYAEWFLGYGLEVSVIWAVNTVRLL